MKRTLKTSRTRTRHRHAWTATLDKLKRSVAGALVVTLSIVALAFFSSGNLTGQALRSAVPTTTMHQSVKTIQEKYDTACLSGAEGWEEACRTAVTALRGLKSDENTGAANLITNYENKIRNQNQAVSQGASAATKATLQSSSTSLPVTLIPQEGSIIGGDKNKCKNLVKHFRDGNFEIWELPCYVQYLSEVALYFAGGISVLFVIIGGYKYMIGSISDDKEGGKKTLQYALTGFTITLLAWTIVNVWQVYVTTGEREGKPAAEYTSEETIATDTQITGEAPPSAPVDMGTLGDITLTCADGKEIDAVMAYVAANEGAKNNKYMINGNPTIGVGHDCKTNPNPICSKNSITNAEMLQLYVADYADHVRRAAQAVSGFDGLDSVRKAVVIDLTFNQGGGWAKKFPRFIEALSAKNYEEAYKELTLNSAKNGDSLYLKQVGARARRNAQLIRTGNAAPLKQQASTNKVALQMLCSGATQAKSDTGSGTAE